MMPELIIVEHHSGYRLNHEDAIAKRWGLANGAAVDIAALSQLQRARVLTRDAGLVVGTIPFIRAALKQRKLEMPVINCYPECLKPYLCRHIDACQLHQAIHRAESGGSLFVKPSARLKRFTGFLLQDRRDPQIAGVPMAEPVYASAKVDWLSEWRYYVANGNIQCVSHYSGDPSAIPDYKIAEAAVKTYSAEDGAPSGYAIDFGVLTTGETALVEVNDGFGIGAYADTVTDAYMEMLIARWNQIVSQ
jgi:hypothetical protein